MNHPSENGFDYLYVTPDDYELLAKMNNALVAEPVTLKGNEVFKLTEIIGTEPDLGFYGCCSTAFKMSTI